MPTRDRPEPPTDLDPDARAAVAALEDLEPDELRAIGRYLEDLASRRESTEAGGEREATDESVAEADADHEYPADVPERAEVTVKEIAGTTYYYYQWRDGDRIESKTVQR